ncbi:MAG: pitrilysin family protein [Gemmatimonadetes bacterium]|nr:pitrilysin family protein [Gemmatimonadota bacterium]
MIALLSTLTLALALSSTPVSPSARNAPVVAPAADSLKTMYSVGGVRVIHRRANVSTVVTNIYLLGGVRSAPAGRSGIENFLLQVGERGTAKYPRDVLRRSLARTGSEMVIESREDWTMIGARTTPTALDSTWAILADRVMSPRLDSADVEFVREQLLSALRQRSDSPDAMLAYLSDSTAFAGSSYALSPVGTEGTIANTTHAELVRFQREQIVKSRILLVVVGNVDRATVERMVSGTLASLPAGSYGWTMPDTLPTGGSDALIVRRAVPTNYLQGSFQGPPATSSDAAALRVASAVLSGRLFGEVRSKRNLTYAVSANYSDRALTSVGLYVTTTFPDSVVALMAAEVGRLQTFEIQTNYLLPIIQQFITEYFLENESSTAQANFLTRALLYRGDFLAGERFVSDLRAVTGADVRRVARRYFQNPRWVYIGDPSRVSREKLTGF